MQRIERRPSNVLVSARLRWAISVGVATVCASSPVLAQGRPSEAQAVRATVVRLDHGDLIIDTGSEAGVTAATEFTLYRPITVRHPITGRPLRDRFALGTVRLRVVGRVLSLASTDPALLREPAVGDELESTTLVTSSTASRPGPVEPNASEADGRPPTLVEMPRQGAVRRPPDRPPQMVAVPGVSAEDAALLATWLATFGRTPEVRINEYRRFLARHPSSPRALAINREIDALRGLVAQSQREDEERGDASRVPSGPQPLTATAGALPSYDEGEQAVLSLQALPLDEVRAVLMHVRAIHSGTYMTFGARPDREGFVRIEVPSSVVRAPGFEYFVVGVRNNGAEFDVVGNGASPVAVVVHPPAPAERRPSESTTVELRADLVDRNRLRGNDWYLQIEGDFFQRLSLGPLFGYRVGFGIFRGETGSLQQLDVMNLPPTPLQVAFGFHELEFKIAAILSLVGRVTVGMNGAGLVAGAQARVRIGDERAIWLMVGGEVLSAFGQRGFAQLMFRPHPSIRLGALFEVTHFEFDRGDPSFRIAATSTFQIARWFGVGVRAGYQARNIAHSGPSGGLSLRFDW